METSGTRSSPLASEASSPALTSIVDHQKALQRSMRLEKDATSQRKKRAQLKLALLLMPIRVLTPEEVKIKAEKRKHKTELEQIRNNKKKQRRMDASLQDQSVIEDDLSMAFAAANIAESDSTRRKRRVHSIYLYIQQATGALGGNGAGGPIYGELSIGSMQQVVDFLVLYCALNTLSLFLDIGSGRGKPNFHVAQDPGVRLSIGVEVEDVRFSVS